jgi:DNA-binding response OmpR family regulator
VTDETQRPAPTVLVVDDEPAMVGALGALLGQAGYRIVAAYDGEEALRRFSEGPIDVVLLDLAMPGVDGAEVCRRLRARSDVPIIVVSGERDGAAPVELLDLGADDYVRKPFRGEELLARIRASLRRGSHAAASRRGGWEVDFRRHELRWQDRPLPVTQIEFRLLRVLVERRGELVRHEELLSAGWPDTSDPDPLWLKPHLARLRKKLAEAGASTPVAVRGVGYRLEE